MPRIDYAQRDIEHWQRLESVLAERDTAHTLANFAAYARRRDLVRFIAHYELFKNIIDLPGCVVECGVFHGASLFTWAKLMQIIARLPGELFYDLPPELIGKLWGGKYRGQRQSWYLVRFTGADSDIDLTADKHPEFCEWKWVEPDLLPDLIVPFKREVYQTIVDGFRDKL